MDYTLYDSQYIPSENERLYNQVHGSKSQNPVYLLFLVRRTLDRVHNRGTIPLLYIAPNDPHYQVSGKYNELNYRLNNHELRMEFYLSALKQFCNPSAKIYSIFGGSKLLAAGMMSPLDHYCLIHADDTDQFVSRRREFKKLDMNDFIWSVYVPKGLSKNVEPKSVVKKKGKKQVKKALRNESSDDEEMDADPLPEDQPPAQVVILPSDEVDDAGAESNSYNKQLIVPCD